MNENQQIAKLTRQVKELSQALTSPTLSKSMEEAILDEMDKITFLLDQLQEK